MIKGIDGKNVVLFVNQNFELVIFFDISRNYKKHHTLNVRESSNLAILLI